MAKRRQRASRVNRETRTNKYNKRPEGFNSVKSFNQRVDYANAISSNIALLWREGYESFWQVPRTHGDKAVSMEDLQSVINEDQVEIGEILTDSNGFLSFIQANHPETLGDDCIIPDRYLTFPYFYTGEIGSNITLTSLKPVWDVQ